MDEIPKDDIYVVQKYMREPYLIDGLKFDIRLYVLVLSADPLRIFLYRDGLVRFATKTYQPIQSDSEKQQLNNLCVHLTNYAINKDQKDFIAPKSINDDKSHKRTVHKVFERLRQENQDPEKLMGEIKEIIVKTILPIQSDLAHNYRTC